MDSSSTSSTDSIQNSGFVAEASIQLERLALLAQHRRTPQVWYVAHPLRPTPEQIRLAAEELPSWAAKVESWGRFKPGPAERRALEQNLTGAKRWIAWLRQRFPRLTFIAPWLAALVAGVDDSDPQQRAAGMADAEAVIARCDGVVLCGGRISEGMARGRDAAARVIDLTALGERPPAATVTGAPAQSASDGPAARLLDALASAGDREPRKRVAAAPGYELLAAVLDEALEQAQAGKGRDRHGFSGAAFQDQTIVALNELLGSIHGQAYQVAKKVVEATRLPADRARRDLLGAINYAAAAIIQLDRQSGRSGS